jgi:hypothetical protein
MRFTKRSVPYLLSGVHKTTRKIQAYQEVPYEISTNITCVSAHAVTTFNLTRLSAYALSQLVSGMELTCSPGRFPIWKWATAFNIKENLRHTFLEC